VDNKKKPVVRGKNRSENFKEMVILFFLGGVIGFLNGFFGGGGGVVGVPAIEKFLKVDNKTAHATCLALILPLSIISAGIYVFSGNINSSVFLFVGGGVLVGGVLGALLLKILPEKIVRIIFAVILFAGGVRLLLWWFFIYLQGFLVEFLEEWVWEEELLLFLFW